MIGFAVWRYLDSVAEALAAVLVLAIVVTLLFTPLVANLPELRLVSSSDQQIITRIFTSHPTRIIVTLLIILRLAHYSLCIKSLRNYYRSRCRARSLGAIPVRK